MVSDQSARNGSSCSLRAWASTEKDSNIAKNILSMNSEPWIAATGSNEWVSLDLRNDVSLKQIRIENWTTTEISIVSYDPNSGESICIVPKAKLEKFSISKFDGKQVICRYIKVICFSGDPVVGLVGVHANYTISEDNHRHNEPSSGSEPIQSPEFTLAEAQSRHIDADYRVAHSELTRRHRLVQLHFEAARDTCNMEVSDEMVRRSKQLLTEFRERTLSKISDTVADVSQRSQALAEAHHKIELVEKAVLQRILDCAVKPNEYRMDRKWAYDDALKHARDVLFCAGGDNERQATDQIRLFLDNPCYLTASSKRLDSCDPGEKSSGRQVSR
eukprot:Rmarinus@m.4019